MKSRWPILKQPKTRQRFRLKKELALKELELKTQGQASTSAAADPAPRKRDAKSPKLPAFMDEKDELDS